MLTGQGWTQIVHHFGGHASLPDTVFRHVIIDDSTGDVFVSGVNVLYKLSGSLQLVTYNVTGPKPDHLNCQPDPKLACNYSRNATNNVNQALVIVPWQHLVIACSTLYYGYCEKFSMFNLTHIETVYAHVVPNDQHASVVVVVSSGDVDAGGSSPAKLYIGTTHSNVGSVLFNNKVPMVSSRSVDTLKHTTKFTTSTFIDLLPQYLMEDFKIYFKAGFSHETYTYFVVVRPKSVNGLLVYSTWLARLCHGDDQFHSYIEVPLECSVGNHTYTLATAAHLARPTQRFPRFNQAGDALFVSFSTAEGNTANTTTDAAVCAYTMGHVKIKFVQNIKKCFFGEGKIGPAHLVMPRRCTPANVDFCGQNDFNNPIEGQLPILASSVHPLTGHMVTSLAVKPVGQFIVALLGSDQGQLVKMVLWPSSGPRTANPVYGVLDIELGMAIKHDLLLDSSDAHAYVLTSSKVYMVQLSDCSPYKSCGACHAVADPHCGWCMLQNRCTLPTECADSDVVHNWVSFLGNWCPAISSLTPHMVDRSRFRDTKFVVNLRNVPLIADQSGLKCELQSTQRKLFSMTESVTSDTVTCQPFSSNQSVPSDTGFVELEFSVVMNDTRVASKPVFVYQCSFLDSCTRCTETKFGCVWCPLDGSCVNSTYVCTNNQDISSSSSCPWVSSLGVDPASGTKELLLPAGVSSAVDVIVINLQEQYAKNLKCRFAIGGGLIVSANVSQPVTPESTHITCQAIEFNFKENQPFKTVAVDVLWGDNKSLDSPNKTHVQIYKCDAMKDTCGQCLILEPHYHCGWCVDHCSLKDHCLVGWLDRSRTCPNPQITTFSPTSGPVLGGTKIMVNGSNLGKVFEDLVGGVTVAGVPCKVRQENYVPSMSFTCMTSAAVCVTSDGGCVTSESGDVQTGGVKVVVNETYNAESVEHFHYVIPKLTDFHPKKGPLAGGTRVTVRGEHLDTGYEANITQNGSVSQVLSRNRTYLVFNTTEQSQPGMASVHVVIDNQECRLDDKKFEYITNPTIISVKPKKAIFKGGIRLTVRGTALDSVAEPSLVLKLPSGHVYVACTVVTSTEMHCLVPPLGIRQHSALYIKFGFLMDGVTALEDISTTQPNIGTMMLLPNPVAYPFLEEGGVREYDAEGLVILGQNLNVLGHFPQTFHILVGSSPCNVTAFQTNQILCVPPRQPLHLNEDRKAKVVVTLGNFWADIGFLHYTEDSGSLPMLLILGIALGVSLPLLLILLFLLFICLRRHYSQTHKKPMVKLVPDAAGSLRPMYRYQQENAANTDRNGQALEMVPLRSDEDGAASDINNGQGNSNACLSAVLDGIHDTILKRTIQEVLVPRERLEIGDVIGKGHFGCVYVARMRDAELGFAVKVAVKTLQGNNFNQEAIESFLAEGVIMKDFNHPHILRLLGMSIDERGNPMVILPYMANGDLRSYVKDKTRSFTARQLLRLAQQVAEGMAYLASLNFIHRDLAARNCMIDDVMTVKVADFGLARCLYQKEYYSSREHKGKMPIKWMALESLEDLIFTTKSDVWSFGVLLWELMTRCMTPYPDVDVFDIRNYLASGQRLRQPKYCPDSIYKIMCDCWHAKPEKRPSFIDLVNQLELLLNPPSKKRFPLDGGEPMYMNIRLESSDYLEPISTEEGDNGWKSGQDLGKVDFV